MIRPPSNQKSYDLFFSGDPAIIQLPDEPTEEQAAEYWQRIDGAIETGRWDYVLVEGAGQPTKFTLRPLSTEHYGALKDMISAGLGKNGSCALALRICLQGVTNLEGFTKLKYFHHEVFGKIASLSFLEDAGLHGDWGLAVVNELGLRVLKKAQDAPPK